MGDLGGRAARRASVARTAPPPTTSPHGLLAGVGAFTAIGAIMLVHLLTLTAVDPIANPLSHYGLSTQSAGLFALSCLALAGASVALARRLTPLGRVSAYAAAAMLVLVVVFPTDEDDGTLSPTAHIHRYAAGAAFVLLALVLLSAAGRCRPAMRRWVAGSLVVVMLALTDRCGDVLAGLSGDGAVAWHPIAGAC